MNRRNTIRAAAILFAGGPSLAALCQALPPVPVPASNPITEPKRVLGKIIFWDEQMSVDGTMACATCHTMNRAGTDARRARGPGSDGVFNTADDVFASPGVLHSDSIKDFVRDVTYGTQKQVTGRAAASPINAAYATDLFWDGRARSQFTDPQTGQVSIASGGALESQSVGPPASSVEMAHEGVTWTEIASRLAAVRPLALATNIPSDVASALTGQPGYPELFRRAFGDTAITADRIARAVATYERTLIADQTPFDLGTLTPNQQQGLNRMTADNCTVCHTPPLFTDNSFRNIGLRPPTEDLGRQNVTGNTADRGKFKVPSLRNVSLKTQYMHNGMFVATTPPFQQVFAFYDRAPGTVQFTDNRDPIMPAVHMPPTDAGAVTDFLTNGLRDPRVASETFPFDHPTLYSTRAADQPALLSGGTPGSGGIVPQIIALSPPMIGNKDFRIGLDRALGGASAQLIISNSPPVNGRLTPTIFLDTRTTGGSGAGNGLATDHWPLTGASLFAGQTLYAQWVVSDPAAAGGQAFSTVASFRLFCGSQGCGPVCAVDWNSDGVVAVGDLFLFFNAWFANAATADFNGVGGVSVQDVFDFLAAWFAGC